MKDSIKNFLQPDPNTCVPTTFSYLIHKIHGEDFNDLLSKIIPMCYESYDLESDGMEFDQMCVIAEKVGYKCFISKAKPKTKSYLVGVNRLPQCKFDGESELIKKSIIEKSLELNDTEFIYPFGHAVAVFENEDEISVYDSFIGNERKMDFEVLKNCVEENGDYLWIE